MIRLQAGEILLQREDGDFEFLDLDELHEILWQSCLDASIEDCELPGDIIDIVINYVNNQETVNRDQVNSMVLQVLTDSGLHGLSTAFQNMTSASYPENSRDKMVDPYSVDITKMLHEDPFFIAKPVPQLSSMVLAQFDKLGFNNCSRGFVLELARNTWFNLQRPRSPDSYWLIHHKEFSSFCHDEQIRLIGRGILKIKSISMLFPALQLNAELTTLTKDLGPNILPELQLYPNLNQLCDSIVKIKHSVIDELKQRLEPGTKNKLPVTVNFQGAKEIIDSFSGKEKKCLNKEFDSILQAQLVPENIKWVIS